MINILICDDQDLVCEGLRVILGSDPELNVVGVAYNGQQALDLLQHTTCDVLLLDLKMPIMNGIQTTKQVRSTYPQVRILILTTYDADEWLFDAIRNGAHGYLLKDSPREALSSAIKGIINEGITPIAPQIAGKLFAFIADNPQNSTATNTKHHTQLLNDLSEREREVLRLIAQGHSNTAIAHTLYLSEGTVRNYVSTIFDKLGVSDRTQAALLALRMGLAQL
jgi:DNA-binding NarL/FixJ family response regulator